MVKQVIVVRHDLKMRKGKIGAQCSHASMKVFFDRFKNEKKNVYSIKVSDEMNEWIQGAFTKIVVYVNSEEELLAIYDRAKEAGLPCSLIKDNGLTEFGGVPTHTCIAIGPDKAEKIDLITGNLPLY
jgi:PTH2 family peptidyl-tRNA hydrolase